MTHNGLKPGSLDDLLEQDLESFGLQHTLQRMELLCAEKATMSKESNINRALRWKLFSLKLQRLSQEAGELLP